MLCAGELHLAAAVPGAPLRSQELSTCCSVCELGVNPPHQGGSSASLPQPLGNVFSDGSGFSPFPPDSPPIFTVRGDEPL